MANFQDKNQPNAFRRILESWPMIIILGFFVLLFAWGVYGFLGKMQETHRNKVIAEDRVQELQERKIKLENDIENLNTDKGKEKVFRENFGMGKEGEGVIVIVEDKNLSANSTEPASSKRFLNFFTNLFQ